MTAATRQLDEISTAIGELRAYAHEHRHASNNLAQKFDGLAVDLAKRIESSSERLNVRLEELVAKLSIRISEAERRIDALEADRDRREGAIGVLGWLSKHWPFALLSTALGVLVAWANGKFGR